MKAVQKHNESEHEHPVRSGRHEYPVRVPKVHPFPAQCSTGWLAIAVGIIGILLPLLPGIPFLLLGSWLLGWELTLLKELWRSLPFARFLPFAHLSSKSISEQKK